MVDLMFRIKLLGGRGGKGCSSLNRDYLTDYLELLWLFGPQQTPPAVTVGDAIQIEQEMFRRSNADAPVVRKRPEPFAVAQRVADDPLPHHIVANPSVFEERGPNLWRSTNKQVTVVGIAFSNLTQRPIYRPTMKLYLKRPDAAGYASLDCSTGASMDAMRQSASRGPKIAPGERVVYSCRNFDQEWQSDQYASQFLEKLQSPEGWYTEGQSHDRANWLFNQFRSPEASVLTVSLLRNSTCEDRDTCDLECGVPGKMRSASCPDDAGCFSHHYERALLGKGTTRDVFEEKTCRIDLKEFRRNIKDVKAMIAAPQRREAGIRVLPANDLSQDQEIVFGELGKSYVTTFTILGRAQSCGIDVDERRQELLKEVEVRHGLEGQQLNVAAVAVMAGVLAGPSAIVLPCSLFDDRVKRLQLPSVPALLRESKVPSSN